MSPDSSHTDDYILIRDFKSGRVDALKKIYDLQYLPLWNFANRLLKDEACAEDIVAETFIKLWQRHEQFENLKSVTAFIFTVTRNACFDYLKHKSRKEKSLSEVAYLFGINEALCNTELVRMELVQLALAEADGMPPQMKKIYNLLYVDGLSLSEVAEKTGLSINTVKAQKVKALKKVRGAFAKKDLLIFLQAFFLFFIF